MEHHEPGYHGACRLETQLKRRLASQHMQGFMRKQKNQVFFTLLVLVLLLVLTT
jgi:hypothetical protein